MLHRTSILTTCLLSLASLTSSVSGQGLSVKSILSKPLIDPQLPLQEVQAFAGARILPMPEVDSVDAWEKYAKTVRQRVLQEVVFLGEAER